MPMLDGVDLERTAIPRQNTLLMSHIIIEKMLCVLAYGENGSLGNSQHLMSIDVAENL